MIRTIGTPKNVQSVSSCHPFCIVVISELAGVSGVHRPITGQDIRCQLAAHAPMCNLPDRGKIWRVGPRHQHKGCVVQRMHQRGRNTWHHLLAYQAVSVEAIPRLPVCNARG